MGRRVWMVGLVILGCFLFSLGLAYSQGEKFDAEKLKESFMKALEAQSYAVNSSKFTCPRYLLRWGMGFFEEKDKETAIKIAKIAKVLTELAKKDITRHQTALDTRYSEELKDPKIKQKMIDYTDAMIKAADEHIKYFESGDEKFITTLDKYFNEAAKYDKEVEALLTGPILVGGDAVINAATMCPRWLTTWAESYSFTEADILYGERGYRKDIIVCADCVEIVKAAKSINEVFSEKWFANIQDGALQEKYLRYIKAAINMDDALIKLYQTGDQSIAEDASKYQEEFLAIEKEIVQYTPVQQQ